MEQDALCVHPRRDTHQERVLDWITALLPLLLLSLIYYRGQALALHVTAIGGYLMAALLLLWAMKKPWTDLRVAPAVFCGVLAAFCLPATAPWWLSALFGGVAAVANTAPALIEQVKPAWRIAQPLMHPVLLAFLLIRIVFPNQLTDYTMPAQFAPVDGVAGATPLAALQSGEVADLWQLLFGIHAAAIGEGCVVAILLGALYLLLRRRIRLIAPTCLLAIAFLLAWGQYGSLGYALYALLSGGLLLGCLMFADAATAPTSARDQIVVGVVAGVIIGLVRFFGGWTEGVAVGVLAAQVLLPFLPYVYKVCRVFWTFTARWARVVWGWAKPHLARVFRFLSAKIAVGAKWLWGAICRGIKALIAYIKNLLRKNKK